MATDCQTKKSCTKSLLSILNNNKHYLTCGFEADHFQSSRHHHSLPLQDKRHPVSDTCTTKAALSTGTDAQICLRVRYFFFFSHLKSNNVGKKRTSLTEQEAKESKMISPAHQKGNYLIIRWRDAIENLQPL